MCENLSVRSGSFYSHLDDKDLFIACNVQGEKIEMSVSTSFDRGDVDIHSVENCCEKNAAVISLNVYEHGVIASVKETALLKAGTALVFQKAVKEKYHIVCERGTQDGISRAMGNKVIDFKDMNNESMPAHKYDDDGIRRDGINPLTHSGYWEEEQ